MTDSRRDEPVRLTRIYTRTGDGGETSLGDGTRTSKVDPLIAAIGTVDELNAAIGLALAVDLSERLRIGQERVESLERLCDELNAELEPLRSFVIPGGGGEGGARLHLARAICRRAEREVLSAARERAQSPPVAVYLNRLSDLPVICASVAAEDGQERLWRPGASE